MVLGVLTLLQSLLCALDLSVDLNALGELQPCICRTCCHFCEMLCVVIGFASSH